MEITSKRFDELSKDELYEILRLRAQVFVVEQNCAYQDLDDLDQDALHIIGRVDGDVVAYMRAYLEEGSIHLGRILTTVRGKGYGRMILHEGMTIAVSEFKVGHIILEAQTYVKKLYESEGFAQKSDEFLLDGIPHIRMEKNVGRC
jgi:ElaA protein